MEIAEGDAWGRHLPSDRQRRLGGLEALRHGFRSIRESASGIGYRAPLPSEALISANLNNHHRNTLDAIFTHPTSGNIEWHSVLSLIEAVGSAVEEHNGKVKITLGDQSEVLHAPHGKDIDTQTIVDLRQMLAAAGYAPHTGT